MVSMEYLLPYDCDKMIAVSAIGRFICQLLDNPDLKLGVNYLMFSSPNPSPTDLQF